MSSDEPIDALTAFLCVLTPDGGLDVFTEALPTVNIKRRADLSDIEAAALRLGAEANRRLLQESLQESPPPQPGDLVSQALAKRSEA